MKGVKVWLVVNTDYDEFHELMDDAIENIEGDAYEIYDIKFSSVMMANDMEYQALIIYGVGEALDKTS